MTSEENEAVRGRHYKGATIAWGGGVMYDFDNPNPEVVTLQDIGWAYACTERWRGQTRSRGKRCFFGVAQHCVFGAEEMLREHGPAEALAFLWHEDDEIVLPNVPGPVKQDVPDWKTLAKRQGDAFLAHWRIPPGDPVLQKAWDLRMLVTEKRDLLTGHDLDRFHTSERVTVDEAIYAPFERRIYPYATIEDGANMWIFTHQMLAAKVGLLHA